MSCSTRQRGRSFTSHATCEMKTCGISQTTCHCCLTSRCSTQTCGTLDYSHERTDSKCACTQANAMHARQRKDAVPKSMQATCGAYIHPRKTPQTWQTAWDKVSHRQGRTCVHVSDKTLHLLVRRYLSRHEQPQQRFRQRLLPARRLR
jgi:hypothetical protein